MNEQISKWMNESNNITVYCDLSSSQGCSSLRHGGSSESVGGSLNLLSLWACSPRLWQYIRVSVAATRQLNDNFISIDFKWTTVSSKSQTLYWVCDLCRPKLQIKVSFDSLGVAIFSCATEESSEKMGCVILFHPVEFHCFFITVSKYHEITKQKQIDLISCSVCCD